MIQTAIIEANFYLRTSPAKHGTILLKKIFTKMNEK